MDKDSAIQRIIQLALSLKPNLNENDLTFRATKLVLDVLDYCHRADFPETLCYAVAGLLAKNLAGEGDGATSTDAPLKALTQDDTKFEWAVGEVDSTLSADELIFNALKPRLNLYRKVVGL